MSFVFCFSFLVSFVNARLQVFGCFAYGMWRVACTIWPVMPVAVASVGGVWRVAPGHASGTLFGQLANDVWAHSLQHISYGKLVMAY